MNAPINPGNNTSRSNKPVFDPAPTEAYLRNRALLAPILSEEVFGKPLGNGVDALPHLDQVLGLARGTSAPEGQDAIITTFGAYVGETLRNTHGGQWTDDPEQGWCLTNVGAPGARVNPFEWVRNGNVSGSYEQWKNSMDKPGWKGAGTPGWTGNGTTKKGKHDY